MKPKPKPLKGALSSLPPLWPEPPDPPDVFISLTKRRLRRLKYWRVLFHNGTTHLPPVLVVAYTKTQARALAESSVPESLYGPNVVFLKAEPSTELPITLRKEDFELIAEKTGIHL